MSAMSIQAARIRSSASDTTAHLGKVPIMDERKTRQSDKGDSDESSDAYSKEDSEKTKESAMKKEARKKKSVRIRVVKKQGKAKSNEEDDDEDYGSHSESSESESTEDSSESTVDSEQSASESQDYDFNEFDADGRSSYEVMGFRSAFPTSRPPIIRGREKESRSALKWVANDCTYAAAALRRARPKKPFAAGFFDRIEMLRRVVLSELAKARSPIEALAAAGIAFDREMLIISAEEVYSRESAKRKVCDTKPGNFEELAAELEIAARKSRLSKGAQRLGGWRRPQSPAMSKPKKPYFEPFRQEGIELLHAARCPRAKTASTPRPASRRWSSWQHVGKMEGMEAVRRTKDAGAMAAEWRSTQVERSCAACKRRGGEVEEFRIELKGGQLIPRASGNTHFPALVLFAVLVSSPTDRHVNHVSRDKPSEEQFSGDRSPGGERRETVESSKSRSVEESCRGEQRVCEGRGD